MIWILVLGALGLLAGRFRLPAWCGCVVLLGLVFTAHVVLLGADPIVWMVWICVVLLAGIKGFVFADEPGVSLRGLACFEGWPAASRVSGADLVSECPQGEGSGRLLEQEMECRLLADDAALGGVMGRELGVFRGLLHLGALTPGGHHGAGERGVWLADRCFFGARTICFTGGSLREGPREGRGFALGGGAAGVPFSSGIPNGSHGAMPSLL